eukprot:365455-Chlamydomonas_euryale.AAC.24
MPRMLFHAATVASGKAGLREGSQYGSCCCAGVGCIYTPHAWRTLSRERAQWVWGVISEDDLAHARGVGARWHSRRLDAFSGGVGTRIHAAS